MAKKNVFVIGLDDFNRKKMERLPIASQCAFHPALDVSDFRGVQSIDILGLIDRAIGNIERADTSVDGVCAFWDFPATTMIPVLAKHFGVPGPSLEAIVACEHKYWSRLEHAKAIPDNIPPFEPFDPFDDDAYAKISLVPPFWIKPMKSFRSFLAFRVNGSRDFNAAVAKMRERVGFMNEPFQALMRKYDLPLEFIEMKESCIAEAPLNGSQCTLEGYVQRGRVVVYGIVDTVRDLDRSSFSRYEYPSLLPMEVQHQMINAARAAVLQVGLDDSPFNVEFFYDQTNDKVFLLEINPRISQSHTDIFEKVHGVSHHRVMLALALGQKPPTMDRKGRFSTAANFMLRTFERGKVVSVPPREQIDALEAELGATVKMYVEEGQSLVDLEGQDSYSFELANLFIGGRDRNDLLDKYDRCLEMLKFEITPDEPIIY